LLLEEKKGQGDQELSKNLYASAHDAMAFD
jgi:hypothetical protein